MWYIIIIITAILVGFFVWTSREDKKEEKKEDMKHEEKPLFHTDEDQAEYGKP